MLVDRITEAGPTARRLFPSDTLQREKDDFEEAMAQATVTRQPQTVKVGGEKFIVEDDGAGRIVRPA